MFSSIKTRVRLQQLCVVLYRVEGPETSFLTSNSCRGRVLPAGSLQQRKYSTFTEPRKPDYDKERGPPPVTVTAARCYAAGVMSSRYKGEASRSCGQPSLRKPGLRFEFGDFRHFLLRMRRIRIVRFCLTWRHRRSTDSRKR
ncbi:hypothetical protein J6590_028913 [Homalodisca vitripennis]|nr:hypothetical protein J6590_028913 [Homalodisca vitripennis]